MKRRQFMWTMAGTAAVAGLGVWREAGRPRLAGPLRITGNGWALGAEVHLTVLHKDRETGEAAIRAAFAELDRVEQVLSLYRPESEISRLNRMGRLDKAHPWLKEVVASALALSSSTGGAFDITVQPLYEAYRAASENNRLPGPAEREAARARVDWKQVELDGPGIRLRGPETRITLNGIAQGFAADRVACVLMEHGISDALVDTGEVNAGGKPANREAWRVGIRHPRHRDAPLATAGLRGRCLATSGDYETRFGTDYSSHHLFDPRTGLSANGLASVSVVADSAMKADGLSTALFVMGLERGRAFLEGEDAEALFVTKQGRVIPTPGFPLHATSLKA